ncbi:MAG TPA: hypothetical protein VI457_01745 [Methylococcaceae bacterium]|nr:hypothetical protein [Methylococcaceae bacterium]
MKWIAVAWLFFCLTASNRRPSMEAFAVIHALVAVGVTWWAFTGLNPLAFKHWGHALEGSPWAWYGWGLFGFSLLCGLFVTRDLRYRFDPFGDASFLATHRQIGYAAGYAAALFVAYGGGIYQVPLYWTLLAYFVMVSMLPDQANKLKK